MVAVVAGDETVVLRLTHGVHFVAVGLLSSHSVLYPNSVVFRRPARHGKDAERHARLRLALPRDAENATETALSRTHCSLVLLRQQLIEEEVVGAVQRGSLRVENARVVVARRSESGVRDERTLDETAVVGGGVGDETPAEEEAVAQGTVDVEAGVEGPVDERVADAADAERDWWSQEAAVAEAVVEVAVLLMTTKTQRQLSSPRPVDSTHSVPEVHSVAVGGLRVVVSIVEFRRPFL